MIWENVTKFGQNFIAPKIFWLLRLCMSVYKLVFPIRKGNELIHQVLKVAKILNSQNFYVLFLERKEKF